MDEYVNRGEVLSRIYATHSTGGFANEEAYLWLHDEITNLSADVQPVKHGACWVQRGEEYYCSHCGGKAPMDADRKHTVTTKFCPHCGYKMGG